ncbi:uncharacterized protein Dwil_GK24521 [Drosophila willistoni]|uniref:Uncharacterized protein n=1 Tax=Drosophila willistoni TaxID=7260 RepID=B4N090_DROWI|nr:uncharacterized protein LOC6643919 [Drosophila willistoni]EDW77503.2 uncharacterized protein Dwil_GK24521 [Drosophila willistoni]
MFRSELQPGLPLHHFPTPTQLQVLQQRVEDNQQRRPQPPFAAQNVRAPSDASDDRHEEVGLFMRRCYMTAGLFIVVTAWQWMILSYVLKQDGDYIIGGFICLVSSFAVLVILAICVQFRHNVACGYILGWLFVETAAMGIVLMMPERSLEHICLTLLVALSVLVFCYLLGAWVPKVVLPGEITVFLFLVIFIVMSIILLTLSIVTDQPKYKTLYFVLLAVFLVPTSVYHSQVIHGRRFRVPSKEFINFAVSVYVNFLMFFASIYYSMWAWEW